MSELNRIERAGAARSAAQRWRYCSSDSDGWDVGQDSWLRSVTRDPFALPLRRFGQQRAAHALELPSAPRPAPWEIRASGLPSPRPSPPRRRGARTTCCRPARRTTARRRVLVCADRRPRRRACTRPSACARATSPSANFQFLSGSSSRARKRLRCSSFETCRKNFSTSDAVAREVALEVADVLEALLPDVLADAARAAGAGASRISGCTRTTSTSS